MAASLAFPSGVKLPSMAVIALLKVVIRVSIVVSLGFMSCEFRGLVASLFV